MRRAREAGLDLVEVAPTARPPVCKIMDYGKWRYQQQKKADKSKAAVRGGQLKEIKFKTVKIGEHDLNIKIKHAREFLAEGNKVQFTLQFRGREMAHQELGRDIMYKIKTELYQVSKVERDAKMEGKRMILVLQPDNKGDRAVPPPPPTPGVRPAMSGSSLGLQSRPGMGPVGPGISRPATGPVGPGVQRPPTAAPAAPAAVPAAAGAPRPVTAAPTTPAPAAPRPAPAPAPATTSTRS